MGFRELAVLLAVGLVFLTLFGVLRLVAPGLI